MTTTPKQLGVSWYQRPFLLLTALLLALLASGCDLFPGTKDATSAHLCFL